MKFTLYTADCVGSLPNSIYPHKCVITDENSMKAAVAFDHVAAEYTNNHRSNTDFLSCRTDGFKHEVNNFIQTVAVKASVL